MRVALTHLCSAPIGVGYVPLTHSTPVSSYIRWNWDMIRMTKDKEYANVGLSCPQNAQHVQTVQIGKCSGRAAFMTLTAAAALSAMLLSGCGSRKSANETTAALPESAAAIDQTVESTVALVESAPSGVETPAPSGSGMPQELRVDNVTAGTLSSDGSYSVYDNAMFSAEYYTDDFTADDTSEPGVVTFYYMGDARHEPSVRIEYIEGTSIGELRDDIRLSDGELDFEQTGTLSFYDGPVSAFAVKKPETDGISDYYIYYVFEYASGCVQITASSYLDDTDETATTAISDSIAILFDTMEFKSAE